MQYRITFNTNGNRAKVFMVIKFLIMEKFMALFSIKKPLTKPFLLLVAFFTCQPLAVEHLSLTKMLVIKVAREIKLLKAGLSFSLVHGIVLDVAHQFSFSEGTKLLSRFLILTKKTNHRDFYFGFRCK